ncbi:MAG TPA: protein-glutamate O-methyltransferase CheR [Clostridia bacterium]|nr:protein-glutamate O-methyltransferase CheR [Clostridia bacterium]
MSLQEPRKHGLEREPDPCWQKRPHELRLRQREEEKKPNTGELSDFNAFSLDLLSKTGIDLSRYKQSHVKRRVRGLMARLGMTTYEEYVALLARDDARRREFVDHLSINVTEFFRDYDRWQYLQNTILPSMIEEHKSLLIWSAGCSTGAEPYSMGIILEELDPGGNHRILATDIDQAALKVAEEASYPVETLKNVSAMRLLQNFDRLGDRWRLKPSIKNKVRFMVHDLTVDPYPVGVNLVLCRNVVIYLTGEVKDRVYRGLYSALKPGGILFVGGSEIVTGWRALGFELLSPFIYQKRSSHSGLTDSP